MTFTSKSDLSPELKELSHTISLCAKKAGLDFFDTIFEIVDHDQLNAMAAYHGFPNRYPHWRWGMEYDRLKKTYKYGLSVIYELVINTDPSYAYLMKSNPLVVQKTVMAHVFGHVDFFKNNYWFSPTNRKMLDQMANHASVIRKIMDKYGVDTVEHYIDQCLSLDNLIDIHLPLYNNTRLQNNSNKNSQHRFYDFDDQINSEDQDHDDRIKSKKYMDNYVNPKELLAQRIEKRSQQKAKPRAFPENPQRDILKFLIEHAPITSWQKRVLEIIRDEAYYFAPQGQTKILNEGWASFWHSKIMTQLFPVDDSEIIDFCDLHSGVVAENPSGGINPYRLGIELLKYAKLRFEQKQSNLNYQDNHISNIDTERVDRSELGLSKLFEIRTWHNDVTFIDEYLDEEFCHLNKLFLYRYDPKTKKKVIYTREFKLIKKQLLDSITNLGQPIIELVDANYKNRGEMLLQHRFTGKELQNDQAISTLKALHRIWTKPVHINTLLNGEKKTISFDGSNEGITLVS